MTSTVFQSTAERTMHSYEGSSYLLPSDEEERQRLLKQHQLFTRLFSGRLVFPPLMLIGKDEVLDIGTGSGAWLCDARIHIPESVQLYGIDIEPRLFPNYKDLSPNIHLSVCSATDLPSYWSSKFTLVHQRLLVAAYTRDQWQRAIQEIFRVLLPGGYVQLIEGNPEELHGPKTVRFLLFLDEFFESKGMVHRCVGYITDLLRTSGFVDVTSEDVTVNLGKWAGEDGVHGKDIQSGAWRGMRDSVMKVGGFGRFASTEAFDKAMDEIVEEWDRMEGSHTAMRVICGRKPL